MSEADFEQAHRQAQLKALLNQDGNHYRRGTPRSTFVEKFEEACQELINADLLTDAYGVLLQKVIKHAQHAAKQHDDLEAAFQPVINGIYNDREYPLHLPSAVGSTILTGRYYTEKQLLKELKDAFRDGAGRVAGWKDPVGFRWARSNSKYKATWVEPIWEKQ